MINTPISTTRAMVTRTTAMRCARRDHPRRRERGVTGSGRSVVGREWPWDQTNACHHGELYLVDTNGRPVTIGTDDGRRAIGVRGDFEVGSPPGLPTGAPLDVPIAVNLPPLPVHGGERYEWRLTIDG